MRLATLLFSHMILRQTSARQPKVTTVTLTSCSMLLICISSYDSQRKSKLHWSLYAGCNSSVSSYDSSTNFPKMNKSYTGYTMLFGQMIPRENQKSHWSHCDGQHSTLIWSILKLVTLLIIKSSLML